MANEQKELIITRTFDAPRDLVWKAWTDPKILLKWWGPRGVTTRFNAWEMKKGGKLDNVMVAGKEMGDFAGKEWPMIATVEEISPPNKLVFISDAKDDENKNETMVKTKTTVTLDDLGGKTKLTVHVTFLKIAGPRGQSAASGAETGWNQQIDKLGELLARGQ